VVWNGREFFSFAVEPDFVTAGGLTMKFETKLFKDFNYSR